MKNSVIILIGVIIAIIIVGGTVMYSSMNNNNDDNLNNIQIDAADNNTDNVSVDISTDNVSDSSAGDDSSEPYIVSEEIKYNGQQGGGYYREVTYSDGEFRQFDNVTVELIGSSYDSDQDKLPSME